METKMMNRSLRATIVVLSLLTIPFSVFAQTLVAVTPQETPALQQKIFSQKQLDQMLAPIALYPDPLIAQILVAAAYPLEIVEAYRWLQQPDDAELKGASLENALKTKPWDESVKALTAFPQILKTMNDNLRWTESLGNAMIAQQADVMDSIQRLRQMAQAAGTLSSTPQQTVTTDGAYILIEPVYPDTVYVPYYNPALVYGTWPYDDYPPFYFAGYAYPRPVFVFSRPVTIIHVFFHKHRWDWHHRKIHVRDGRHHQDRDIGKRDEGHEWRPDPAHRRSVRIRDDARNERMPSRSLAVTTGPKATPGIPIGRQRQAVTTVRSDDRDRRTTRPATTSQEPPAAPQIHERRDGHREDRREIRQRDDRQQQVRQQIVQQQMKQQQLRRQQEAQQQIQRQQEAARQQTEVQRHRKAARQEQQRQQTARQFRQQAPQQFRQQIMQPRNEARREAARDPDRRNFRDRD